MMNDEVHNPNPKNTSPSEINEPYEPSPRMDLYEHPSCLGSTFISEAFKKSDQMHQTFEKSYLAMTHKLDDMIEFPKSQSKKTYKEDLECEIVIKEQSNNIHGKRKRGGFRERVVKQIKLERNLNHHPLQQASDIPQTQAPTHTHAAEPGHMSVDDLVQLVPQLMTRIESLEKDLKQTKQTMGNAIVKLVKKVKKMEKILKSRRVALTDSEDEDAKNSSKQGRNLQKDESEVFETPKQGKSSGETNISPQGLEAAETLAEVLSQIKTKRRNVKTGVRRRLDAEDVSTGFEDVSTGFTDIKSASEKVSSGGEHVSQREGKAVLEETPQTKRTKKQIREEANALAAKRLQEELELSEAQKKRMAQVQEAAQFYTEEDWDTIRAKMEANADLAKEIAGEDVSEADYAQRMVGLISQRRKLIVEQKAKAQRDKPMTQAQQRHMERFVRMDTEKKNRKRTGEELQTDSSKKLKSGTEGNVEAYMEERVDEPSSEEFPMGSIPQGPAPAKIVKWQIIKTGKRGAYQIIREDNTDVVCVNFQGLLNDLTRDDLKELYRLMMLKYGDNRPEEEFERVLWGDLKTMFDPPSTKDAVWNLTHQQKVVHCLNLESSDIYMLTERKYPLTAEVCKAMLDKKLQGGKPDEDCYKLLKWMEKQAGIRK
ncbi:hypothetical protein Tco_0741015 [Tanacetum coccineum]